MKLLPFVSSAAATSIPVVALGLLLGSASGMSVGSSASGVQGVVNSIVDSTSVTVQSYNLYGLPDQWGLFFGGTSAIGMDHGVVLSSSVIAGAVGIYMHDHLATGHNTTGNAMLSEPHPAPEQQRHAEPHPAPEQQRHVRRGDAAAGLRVQPSVHARSSSATCFGATSSRTTRPLGTTTPWGRF